jgi:hypothetical protein
MWVTVKVIIREEKAKDKRKLEKTIARQPQNNHNTRPDQTRQGKTREDKERQGKTRQKD